MVLADEARLSKHAQRRMRQRRIEEWEVYYVLQHGHYLVGDEDICVRIPQHEHREWAHAEHRRLSELVVVLSPDERMIVTTFWREESRDFGTHHFVEQELRFTVADALGGEFENFRHNQAGE